MNNWGERSTRKKRTPKAKRAASKSAQHEAAAGQLQATVETLKIQLDKIIGLEAERDELKQRNDELLAAWRKVVASTVKDGQRFSLYPSCGALAEMETAIAKHEGPEGWTHVGGGTNE
jgi:seryl-tRNA synthetase